MSDTTRQQLHQIAIELDEQSRTGLTQLQRTLEAHNHTLQQLSREAGAQNSSDTRGQ